MHPKVDLVRSKDTEDNQMRPYDSTKSAAKADRAAKHTVINATTSGAAVVGLLVAVRALVPLPWPQMWDPAIAAAVITAYTAVANWFSAFRADRRRHDC